MGVAVKDQLHVRGSAPPAAAGVLTPEALEFVAQLQREFGPTGAALLERRAVRQAELNAGSLPDFLSATERVRRDVWQVAPTPADLQDRRVEITGPVERKMMINALNSGARVFMADFEDALSPTWANVIQGQANLQEAVRRTLEDTGPEGRRYRLAERPPPPIGRPPGGAPPRRPGVWVGRPPPA